MDKKYIKNEFTNPSVLYRGKPFWSWNGELKEKELIRQAKIMKEMGLGGFFMHSRAGLITEYLGEEWFDLINKVADAAEEEGMEAWLYDEDRYPSGSAGGMVTIDESLRMKSLYVFESSADKYIERENTVAIFVAKLDGINLYAYESIDLSTKDIKNEIKSKIASLENKHSDFKGQWKVLHFAVVPDAPNSNYNGTTYIDTMNLKATERFIELTHEKYKEKCGDRLGRSIKGIFTDEPHRGKLFDSPKEIDGVLSCGVCYTDDIFDEFKKRYGFDVLPVLPELFYRLNGEKVAQVKLFYVDLADNLFLERFAEPINSWCKENGIEFTGHVLHENSLMNQTVPEGSLMRFYEHMSYPGIDSLTEHDNNYFIAKQLLSAARQLDKKWLLSELYGCTGWQFNFKSHKAVGDWQALFGINLRCHHLSWYTMEGESKRDYPASILHQSPWYKYYSKVEDYFSRFGLVMSEGKADCDVLVLNPIESVWCQAYIGWSKWIFNDSPDIEPFEKRYQETFDILTKNNIDFDYGEEEMMSRLCEVKVNEKNEAVLKVGKAEYKVIVVTNMLTIRPTTLELLEKFVSLGGKVIFAGFIPEYVNAVKSERPKNLAEKAIKTEFAETELINKIRECSDVYVETNDSEVYTAVRKDFGDSSYAVAVININRNEKKENTTLKIKAPKGLCLEEWNLENGKRYNAENLCTFDGDVYEIKFNLEAAGSKCFVLNSEKEDLPLVKTFETTETKLINGEFSFIHNEQNVCVLDLIKWNMNGSKESPETEVLWADRYIRDSLNLERRGGEMLQPWFSKLNDKEVYGDLHLRYEFFIEKIPEGEVFLAGERPELNNYKINGTSLVNENEDDFWIDSCFKKMYIPQNALKEGRNEVTVDVKFMRTTNVEAIYLVGDFGVKLEGNKRILTSLPEKIGCENFEKYNLPFYTGEVTYTLTPDSYKDILGEKGKLADKIMLSPYKHTGGCVKVKIGEKTEILSWDPYEADITEAYKNNLSIEVTVVGTRKNVFGPLHQIPAVAEACGPGNFVTSGENWTDEYNLIDSGLKGVIFKAKKEKGE